MTKRLILENVSFFYSSQRWSIGPINLIFDYGINILVGPNAQGKSTLLKLLSGLLTPNAGKILLSGSDITQFDRRELSKLFAWLPQSPHIPTGLKASELLSLGRIPHLTKFWENLLGCEIIEDLIDRLEIPCKSDDYIETLSGGTRQLLQIARILIQDPLIYLLDEPFEGIDQKHQKLILNFLQREAKEKKKLVLISTHHLTQPLQYAEAVFLVENGKIRKIEKQPRSESAVYYQLDF